MNLLLSLIQLNSSDDLYDNLQRVIQYCQKSIKLGAKFIALPEYAFQITHFTQTQIWDEGTPPAIRELKKLAMKNNVWIHGGSVTERANDGNIYNRSYVISEKGIEGFYDKIHLFDASLGTENIYRESSFYKAGNRVTVIKTPWGVIGLTICFDVRYPWLYNELLKKGATIIFVPSAFSCITGEAHWRTLIKARAIETQCFLIATAQCGMHADGNRTYGHSLIANPWGDILNVLGTEEGILMYDMNLSQVYLYRTKIKMKHYWS